MLKEEKWEEEDFTSLYSNNVTNRQEGYSHFPTVMFGHSFYTAHTAIATHNGHVLELALQSRVLFVSKQ